MRTAVERHSRSAVLRDVVPQRVGSLLARVEAGSQEPLPRPPGIGSRRARAWLPRDGLEHQRSWLARGDPHGEGAPAVSLSADQPDEASRRSSKAEL